jgi:DNA polymerase-1
MYANLDKVPALAIRGAKTLPAKLEEHRDAAFLSYELATIKVDVPLDVEVEALVCGEPDREALLALYTEMEFKSWVAEVQRDAARAPGAATGTPARPAKVEPQYETILDQARFDAWLEKLRQAPLFAFDTETTGLDAQKAQLVGLSFAVEPNEAAYVPLAHDYKARRPSWTARPCCWRSSRCWKTRPRQGRPERQVRHQHPGQRQPAIEMRGVAYDTMLESYVLNSTATRHDMDSLAQKYLDHTTISFEDIAGKGAKQLTFNQIPWTRPALRRRRRRHHPAPAPCAAGAPGRNAERAAGADGHRDAAGAGAGKIERQGALVDAALLGYRAVSWA